MKKLLKKKGFLIDKIHEDSFYENLLLGLPKFLRKSSPFVHDIKLERHPPVTLLELRHWEHANALQLPDDLRNFYLSTNGLHFSYKFTYDKSETGENPSNIITIAVNPLEKFAKLEDITYFTENGGERKSLPPYCKVYAISQLDETKFVVMAQFNLLQPPNFWVYFKDTTFSYLCTDFTVYLRMALVHLGIPGWQLTINGNFSEWSAEMVQILAPGLLNNRKIVSVNVNRNKIDPGIFTYQEDGAVTSDRVEGVGKVKRKVKQLNK